VELIDSDDSTASVFLHVLNTVNDVGSIRVNNVIGTDIGGDVTGLIQCRERLGGADSNLDMTVSGSVLGNLDVSYGAILGLDAVGSLGTSGTPITITTLKKIESIVADEIHAAIETDADVFVQYIETLGVASDGDFMGSLLTKNLTCDGCGAEPAGIVVAGDLLADLTFLVGVFEDITVAGEMTGTLDVAEDLSRFNTISIGGDLTGNVAFGGEVGGTFVIEGDVDSSIAIEMASLPATGVIIVGADLNGDIVMTDTAGLEGFITIGSSPLATTDPWGGDVVVGAYTIGKYYTNPIAQLGGGAVGIVPDWGFHSGDCFPEGSSVCEASSFPDDSTVIISHYGPIDDTVYDDLPIERKPLAGGSWTDITSGFEFSFDAGGPRDLLIDPTTGAWDPGYHYRVTHEEGDLQIPADVLVGESNVDVDAYVYTFCIVP
jgi:hypothetical protein